MKTKIIYEDESLWVIYKPAGLASQSAKVSQPDVVSELKRFSKDNYVGLIHRLDQPVEGLLVVGKNKKVTAALSKQLGNNCLNKKYYAVALIEENEPDKMVTGKSETLCDYMQKDTSARMSKIVTETCLNQNKLPKDVQQAVLSYQIMEIIPEKDKKLALADISIETGRFHQIRAQMAHANLPLLGDQKYASQEAKELSKKMQVRNVALCAYKVTFFHPDMKKEMVYEIRPEGTVFQRFQM